MDGVILDSWKRREVVDTADTHLVEVEISRSFYILSNSPADIQWELRKLLLANVTLSKVGKLLEKIRRLEVLDLSGNQLESISEPEFIAFAPNLRVLRLGGNRLTKIDSKTFQGMKLLESLLLAGNRLKSMDYETQEEFPDDLLDKLPLLATLDLSNNLFKEWQCCKSFAS